jgi:hypothetical protein
MGKERTVKNGRNFGFFKGIGGNSLISSCIIRIYEGRYPKK